MIKRNKIQKTNQIDAFFLYGEKKRKMNAIPVYCKKEIWIMDEKIQRFKIPWTKKRKKESQKKDIPCACKVVILFVRTKTYFVSTLWYIVKRLINSRLYILIISIYIQRIFEVTNHAPKVDFSLFIQGYAKF